MLFRHILGYLPAGVIPAITAFATVVLFSRNVAPATYGAYALGVSVAVVSQAVFFTWLQMGASRFHPSAQQEGGQDALMRSLLAGFLGCAGLFGLVLTATLTLLPLDDHLHGALWLVLPLVLFKALVSINQAFHRGELRVGRYTLLESGQAVLGFALSCLFVLGFDLGSVGMMAGPAVAAFLTAAMDLPGTLRALRGGRIDWVLTRQVLSFGLPLTASFALEFILSTSDRLLVEYFLGTGAVGVYAVSYGIAERSLSSVFMVIATASFPLAVRALEQQGKQAARQQMQTNGIAILALGIPACAGLMMLSPHLAQVLVGEAFRAEAAAIMPYIALAALMGGIKAQYLDHAFYLGQRTGLFVMVCGPAAVLNIALNIVLLPRLGLMGAVYATLIAYFATLVADVVLVRKVFPFDFPWAVLAKVLAATAAMAGVLRLLDLPPDALGLAGMIGAGLATYGAASMALNIGGARFWMRQPT